MFLLVYLFVHSEPMDRAFYGVEMRHQDTPAPRIYPLLLLAVGRKHTAPRFRSPRICPLLLLMFGRKHTAPRFLSPRICSLLLLAVGHKHTAPRFRSPRVYPLLLLAVGRKHTAPRFRSPRVYPLLLLAVGCKHTVPRLPTPQVGSVFRPRQHPTTPLDAQDTASKSFLTSSLSPSGTVLFLPHRHIRYVYIRCFPYRQAAAYRVSFAPP